MFVIVYLWTLVCCCVFKSHWGWRCLRTLCDIDASKGSTGRTTSSSWSSTHMTGTDWWDLWGTVGVRWRRRGKRWTRRWTAPRKWHPWPWRTSGPLTMFSSSPGCTWCVWPEPIMPELLIILPSRRSTAVCKRCSTPETPKSPPASPYTSSPREYTSYWTPFLSSDPPGDSGEIQL